mmetsp:Transcript_38372/g.38771  ORF Transcript_38372/g.38771 Transcript_38372/m.38771 type:complete len:286 (+) Transcript_38372:524-1381(+)
MVGKILSIDNVTKIITIDIQMRTLYAQKRFFFQGFSFINDFVLNTNPAEEIRTQKIISASIITPDKYLASPSYSARASQRIAFNHIVLVVEEFMSQYVSIKDGSMATTSSPKTIKCRIWAKMGAGRARRTAWYENLAPSIDLSPSLRGKITVSSFFSGTTVMLSSFGSVIAIARPIIGRIKLRYNNAPPTGIIGVIVYAAHGQSIARKASESPPWATKIVAAIAASSEARAVPIILGRWPIEPLCMLKAQERAATEDTNFNSSGERKLTAIFLVACKIPIECSSL